MCCIFRFNFALSHIFVLFSVCAVVSFFHIFFWFFFFKTDCEFTHRSSAFSVLMLNEIFRYTIFVLWCLFAFFSFFFVHEDPQFSFGMNPFLSRFQTFSRDVKTCMHKYAVPNLCVFARNCSEHTKKKKKKGNSNVVYLMHKFWPFLSTFFF